MMKKIILAIILVCMSSSAFAYNQPQCDYQHSLMIDAKVDGENAMGDNETIETYVESAKTSAHTAYSMYQMEYGNNANIQALLNSGDAAFDLMIEYNGEAFDNYCYGIGEEGYGDDWYSVSNWDECYPRYDTAEDWYSGMIFWLNLAVTKATIASDDYNEAIELCQ